MDLTDELESSPSFAENKVKLTGYRLLNMSIIAGFGITKAILTYRGYSVVPTALDLLLGVFFAIGCVPSSSNSTSGLKPNDIGCIG